SGRGGDIEARESTIVATIQCNSRTPGGIDQRQRACRNIVSHTPNENYAEFWRLIPLSAYFIIRTASLNAPIASLFDCQGRLLIKLNEVEPAPLARKNNLRTPPALRPICSPTRKASPSGTRKTSSTLLIIH